TTLTLSDDVAALLKRARARAGGTLRGVVNEALRRGLCEMLEERPPSRRFRTKQVSLRPSVPDIDDVAEALAVAEGERFS
ncbi:MAG: hypothetical protein ACRDKJ_10360, partial [Actinomycetota bacterium]